MSEEIAQMKFEYTHQYLIEKLTEQKGILTREDKETLCNNLTTYFQTINKKQKKVFGVIDMSKNQYENKNIGPSQILVEDIIEQLLVKTNKKRNNTFNKVKSTYSKTKTYCEVMKNIFKSYEELPAISNSSRITTDSGSYFLNKNFLYNMMICNYNTPKGEDKVLIAYYSNNICDCVNDDLRWIDGFCDN